MQNIIEKMSGKSIRRIYSFLALLVFVVCLLNFLNMMFWKTTSNDQCGWLPAGKKPAKFLITQVVPGGVSDVAGLKEGDILLKINNRNFRDGFEAMEMINKISFGDYATYSIDRNGYQFETKVKILKVFNITYFSLFLLGLGFLIVGYVVVMTKPKGKIQRMFGVYSLYSMLFFGVYDINVSTSTDPLWLSIPLIIAVITGKMFAPGTFVNFFFYFPVTKSIPYKKWIISAVYFITILWGVIIILIRTNILIFNIPKFFNLIPILFYFIGLLVFTHSYFKRIEPAQRKKLRIILISGIIGCSAYFYIIIINNMFEFVTFLNPTLLLPGLLIILVPLSFGYSIFRYRLMDTDLIIKKSLIYGIITGSIAAIYLLFVLGIGNLFGVILGQTDNQLLTVLAFLVIAFAFNPFKQRVQEWIDRIFYQERYNYQKVLLEFSKELPAQINLEQILNSIVNRISATMHVEKVAVSLCDDSEGCHCLSKNVPEEYCMFDHQNGGLLSELIKTQSPQSFALLANDPDSIKINDEDKKKILKSGFVLVVPMFLKERLIGVINVGPKMSGKIYSQEDIDLLSTVASQAAIAIENARLHLSEIKRKLIEEELSLARKIQQGLLPKNDPEIKELDIAGISTPALWVGGDYYDYIQTGEKKLLVVVGDVSGKGMSAALYMSKIQGMVQLAAYMYKSPKDILIEVNRRIYDTMERKSFITMILALFDLEKKTVSICRAGHLRPLIRTNGKFEYLGSEGIGLGLERGPIFESNLEEVEVPISKNGVYVFYSDGLNEAMNEQLVEFGESKIYALVEKNQNLKAKDLQRIITSTINTYRGTADQNDDITLVVIKSN